MKNKLGKNQHVVPRDGGNWAVKTEGATRDTKVYANKARAVKHATDIAKNKSSELFIHGRTGKIQERNTYGRDKFPPRG